MNRPWLTLGAALMALAIVGTAVALSAHAREPTSAFSPNGRGASPLVEDARTQGLEARRLAGGPLAALDDPQVDAAATLLVVVSPAKPYSAAESRGLLAFIERGGQVLVADNFGRANSLTTPLGLTFERVRLVEAGPSGPTDVAWAGRTFHAQTSAPTALRVDATAGVRVLAASSATSFLDRNGDGLINAADPQGPFPMAVELTLGTQGGRLVALSDPAPLLASGGAAADNPALRQALLEALLPDGGLVLFDESRQPMADPVVAVVAATAAAAAAWPWRGVLIAGGVLLLAALLLPRHRHDWGPHRFRPDHFIRRAFQTATDGGAARAATLGGEEIAWTPRGVTALAGAGALALVGLAFGSAQAGYAAALLLAAAAAALLPGAARVRVERRVGRPFVPEEAEVPVHLALSTASAALEVEVQDTLPQEFRLGAGTPWFRTTLGRADVEADYAVSPALRGPYTIGPTRVRRSDPLLLRRRETLADEGTAIEVEPRSETVNRIPFKTRIPQLTLGPHLVNRAGDGSEFHSLRGYQEGDSYRSINWKASARSKTLVVSQRVHESRTTVTVFLDARAVSGAGPASGTPLAHGCRVALSVASGALRVRDRVRVVVYGDGVQPLQPAPASRQLHELTRMLSRLSAAGSTPFQDALDQVLPDLRPGTPALVLSGLEGDPSLLEGVRALRSRGLLVTVIASPIAVTPADPEDGGPEPEADDILRQRDAVLAELRGAGVAVYDALDGIPLDYLFRVGVPA